MASAKGVFLIPNGPKNLSSLFPDIDFSDMKEYFVEVLDQDNAVVGTSTINTAGCCCKLDKVRVHFLNYLGTFDAINFDRPKVTHSPISTEYQRSLKTPLLKTDSGIERFNVRSNETYECRTTCYSEKQMDWCMEMFDSPKAFMEWTGIQSQSDSFLAIKIEDVKYEKKKEEDRYSYELVLIFKLSNEKIILRN